MATLLALNACTMAPDYVQPPLPVPERYSPNETEGQTIAALDWRVFFHHEHLRDLISNALANNRDIRLAAARVAEARSAWRIEGSALYPQLDAVGTGTRGRILATGTSMYVDAKQVTAQLSASWEIDFWGRLRNMREAARDRYLASEEARRAVATEVVSQVALGYLLELEYAERSALARRSITTREESLRIMRRRFEVGSGSKLDMAQAQVLLAQAQTTLQSLERDRAINRNALALLVGKQVELAREPHGLTEELPDFSLPPGLPSDLLVHRPDIMAAEYQLRAANADIGAARAAFFPNISLTGAYGTSSTELDGLFRDGSRIWSFTPTVALPIFNAGRLKGNLDVAKARQEQAVATYEKTIQSAFRDVSDALVQHTQLKKQIATTRSLLEAQRERARLARLRFDNGRSAYLEVLDAQRDLFDAEQTLVQLQRAELSSLVALYSALGGGFPASRPFETTATPSNGGSDK
ncbi:efflux transporter outer membrane subunit [Novosphingobium mangrovi (ex Huang et al. 2023)]|uniref:Efflux transporter outer membrane subunit n=1 Tax=Novosphingobium mangrovi (ex Huang et al. 2023) TaxID=2976432 RepID=A0ABT2I1S0_9SPHN|nr:efflux transporter outer membrane subunit [Novosphingobium mangrovi (ex Huang et al. 2023)]MCT2398746.1 efflux transporter outer membrane subunit [Novosphingobium mangrovi (ex Huang et al. 2023)]